MGRSQGLEDLHKDDDLHGVRWFALCLLALPPYYREGNGI